MCAWSIVSCYLVTDLRLFAKELFHPVDGKLPGCRFIYGISRDADCSDGLIRQVKSDVPLFGAESWLGFSQMLSACSFVLLFLWMITLLGLTTIRRIHHFRWCDFPFVLNHLGLFLALTGAILGNADMERFADDYKNRTGRMARVGREPENAGVTSGNRTPGLYD